MVRVDDKIPPNVHFITLPAYAHATAVGVSSQGHIMCSTDSGTSPAIKRVYLYYIVAKVPEIHILLYYIACDPHFHFHSRPYVVYLCKI